MANIDKLIIKDPTASEPTNPLEMYVAKINGTYTGDIPEPTNDLEKALKKYYEERPAPGPGPTPTVVGVPVTIQNDSDDALSIEYVNSDFTYMAASIPSGDHLAINLSMVNNNHAQLPDGLIYVSANGERVDISGGNVNNDLVYVYTRNNDGQYSYVVHYYTAAEADTYSIVVATHGS